MTFGHHLQSRFHLTRSNVPQLQLELVHYRLLLTHRAGCFPGSLRRPSGVAATAVVNGGTVITSLTAQGRHLRAAFSACLSFMRHRFLPVSRKGLSCVQSLPASVKLTESNGFG
jgi:hypothetical protein